MSFLVAPKFLSMPAVGLDISADAARFIELEIHGKGMRVSRYATRKFPEGFIEKGQVHENQKLKDSIAALASEYKLSFANISLPEEQAYLVNIEIPRMDVSGVRDAIEFRLEEYIPISGADAVFDYVVADAGSRNKETMDVIVSALPRVVIDEYFQLFKGTGITPKSFEFESQAMARAIIPKGDHGTFLVVDIGKVVTDVFVCVNGIVQFSASLDIGGHFLTQAIEKTLNISYEEAESLKAKHGLVSGSKVQGLYEAMLPIVGDLRARLMRHYSYWQTHHGDKAGGNIEYIYITGGGANLKGLSEYIAAGIDVRVEIANPWVNVATFEEYVPPLTMSESHGYATAIGLALRNTTGE